MATVAKRPKIVDGPSVSSEKKHKSHTKSSTVVIQDSSDNESDEKSKHHKKAKKRDFESKKEQNAESKKDWDIDHYKTEYESEEHWELRRRFMEVHKDKFSEERLVCLAQIFVNMEFMGCRYPLEVMRQVGELSQEVAKEYRKDRTSRLKRTFVSAADAAEQRTKGRRRGAPAQNEMKKLDNKHGDPKSSQTRRFGTGEQQNLFEGCRFGRLILYLTGGRNCLRQSAMTSKLNYEEREGASTDVSKCAEILIEGTVVGTGYGDSLKVAKLKAYKSALQLLQNHCYSIKLNAKREIIKVEKNNNQVVLNVANEAADSLVVDKKLDECNKGFRMMRMMGWSGGGLGLQKQGREDPVGYLLKNNRLGLGAASQLDTANFTGMMTNYVNSDDLRDLQFEPTFTKEERAILHGIAGKFNLRSASYGTGDERRLIVTKKLRNEHILQQILVERNPKYCERYFVQVPEAKAQQFPAHNEPLQLDNWEC